MLERTRNERGGIEGEVEGLRAGLAGLGDPPTDAMLDHFNDVAGAGRVGDAADLNARLRAEFEEFRLDRVDDGVVGVLPVLRLRQATDFDAAAAYREWEAAGMPSHPGGG